MPKIRDTLWPDTMEARRDEIEAAAASAGVGDAYHWVFAHGVEYGRRAALEEAASCAENYDLGIPNGHAIAWCIRALARKEGAT